MDHADRKSLVLVGAGSAVFTRGLLADLISATDLGAWDVALVDVDAGALTVATRMAERMIEGRGVTGTIRVRSSLDRRAVLPGADFVVTCVGVGGDVHHHRRGAQESAAGPGGRPTTRSASATACSSPSGTRSCPGGSPVSCAPRR
jgi:hypothetical protein